jgi:hypothetical protein
MAAQYFKIQAQNLADYDQLLWLMKNKIFYPESSSTPALPVTPNSSFDYRQFFKFIGIERGDGGMIVKSRQVWTAAQFGTAVVPTADWTGRYKLSVAPVITELSDDYELVAGRKVTTTADVFLSYNYLS